MEYQAYKSIYNSLKSYRDVHRLIGEGYDRRFVSSLYSQKISRDVTKRYHIVSSNSAKMLKSWRKGTSMMELAEKWHFPPVLIARFLFLEDGATKKEFAEYLRNPDLLRKDVADELRDAIQCDLVYSPQGVEDQHERCQWGEKLLQDWLTDQGIGFRTEKEIRGIYEKTPDALLEKPMMYGDKKIYWVESKASFGDNTEFMHNCRRQLVRYTELFGPGIVVYWLGKLDDLESPEGVYVEDIGVLEKSLAPSYESE